MMKKKHNGNNNKERVSKILRIVFKTIGHRKICKKKNKNTKKRKNLLHDEVEHSCTPHNKQNREEEKYVQWLQFAKITYMYRVTR